MAVPPAARIPGYPWLVAALCAVAAAGVVIGTSTYGPGLTPDSAQYAAAAESLRAGEGMLDASGRPLTVFPPLLPAALALLVVIGLDVGAAATILNAACLAFVVFAAARISRRLSGNDIAALTTAFAVTFAAPILDSGTYLLTEPLFLAVLSAFSLVFGRAAVDPGWRPLLIAAAIAGTLPLVRYAGGIVIPLGVGLVLLLSPARRRRRFERAVVFGAVSSAPLVLYLARNLAVAGDAAGVRLPSRFSALVVARSFVASWLNMVLPWTWIERLQPYSDLLWALVTFFALALGLVSWVAWLLGRRLAAGADEPRDRADLITLVAFVVAYCAFLCWASWAIAFDVINARFVAPVYPAALVLIAATCGRRDLGGGRRSRIGWLVPGFVLALLVLQVGRFAVTLTDKVDAGAGGYATLQWRDSPMVSYLRSDPPDETAVTNAPDVVYLVTGRRVSGLPHRGFPGWIEELEDRIVAGGGFDLVWFDELAWRTYLPDLDQMREHASVRLLHAEPDGAVYRVETQPPPGIP